MARAAGRAAGGPGAGPQVAPGRVCGERSVGPQGEAGRAGAVSGGERQVGVLTHGGVQSVG